MSTDIKNLLEEINSLTAEVEKLAKSDMYKAEGEEEGKEEGAESAEAPEMSEGAEAPEMSPEGEEGDKIEDQAEELEDAAEEGEESLEEVVKALDDEDLQELMSAIQAEMTARQGGGEEAPAAPAAPEMGKAVPPMHKAMDEMAKTMAEMKKSLDSLRAENVSLKKSAPVSRPAAMNRAEVQTMAKSDAVPEMLNKSEVVEYLLNTKAPVDLVQDASWANSPSALRDVYSKAELKGIKIPTKK